MDEFVDVIFRAAVAAERESELYEIANEKTRFNMDKNEMKIVDVISQEEFYKLQVAILEELRSIRELLKKQK